MTGTGDGIYFIGIIPALLLGVMLTLIALAAREPRPGPPRRNLPRWIAQISQQAGGVRDRGPAPGGSADRAAEGHDQDGRGGRSPGGPGNPDDL